MKTHKKIGIWLDKREAYLVNLNADPVIQHIDSNIETFNPKGGSGSNVKYGPVDTVKEKAYAAKETKQKKEFFQQLAQDINAETDVFLLGPAQMKDEFKKYLQEKIKPTLTAIYVEPADSMTQNQIVARVREFFDN